MNIRFLSVEDVLAIQANTIEHEGGAAGLRDAGLLESAVLMPQQKFGGEYLHKGLAEMATAYLFHLAMNHAFVDGNKRVGVLSALIFLDANGVKELPDPDELERVTMAVASSAMNKRELTAWFEDELTE